MKSKSPADGRAFGLLLFRFFALLVELLEDDPEGFEANEDEDGRKGGQDVESASTGQTDGGGDPETGGGGESADGILVLLEDNGACTDETDAGDDLCRHS